MVLPRTFQGLTLKSSSVRLNQKSRGGIAPLRVLGIGRHPACDSPGSRKHRLTGRRTGVQHPAGAVRVYRYSKQCYNTGMLLRGELLHGVMLETSTTQSELSRISGVRQPSISQFISGRVQMSDDMLERLLSCMGYRLEVVRRPVRSDLRRSPERSWRLHRQLSAHLSASTFQEWRPTMLRNLRRLRVNVKGQPHLRNLDRWQDLIERGDHSGLRRVLTGLDIDSVEMREVSPMGGLLSQGERSEVLGLAL